jgi:hypothetical protein
LSSRLDQAGSSNIRSSEDETPPPHYWARTASHGPSAQL